MTVTELFDCSSDALAITGPAEWDSPDALGQRDTLVYVDDVNTKDSPFWCLESTGSDNDDYVPVDPIMALELIVSHLQEWLLRHGWQVQVMVRMQVRRWRLVDCLTVADGGGDRLDADYPYGDDELLVLCESVIAIVAR